jgi:hypothetical protein
MAQKSRVMSDMKELKNITIELKRLGMETKIIRYKKKEIEDRIMDFLHTENQVGVKLGDLVVMSKEKNGRRRLKKEEKENNAIGVLESMGIINSKQALYSILDSMKGESTITESLHMKESRL